MAGTGNIDNLTNKGRGRPKGSENKATKELKDIIRGALDKVGGLDYLARQAEDNPVAFMSLLGRILPSEIKAQVDADIKGLPTNIVITRPKQDGNKQNSARSDSVCAG